MNYMKAATYAEEFMDANRKIERSNPTQLVHKWIPPPESAAKMNVAWLSSKTRNSMGIGLVVYDHTWALLTAYSEEIPRLGDGLHMAALALIKALQFGKEAGFQRLLIEVTHPHLMAIIQFSEEYLSEIGDLVTIIRNSISKFSYLKFLGISDSCNKVAKLLASYA
jgi:hypothetical protein